MAKPKKPSQRAKAEVLGDMHVTLAEALLKRIQSGAATAADLNVARAFLKDNGIEANVETNEPFKALAETLPFAPTGTSP